MRTNLLVCSALFAAALFLDTALAQEAPSAANLVQPQAATAAVEPRRAPPIAFQVSVVYATEKAGEVDRDALLIVRRLPFKPGTVSMVEQRAMKVHFGDHGKIALPTGGEMSLLPVLVHGNQLHMQVELAPIINTRLKMISGRPVILGGIPHEDGYLIVQVLPEFSQYLTGPQPISPSLPRTIPVVKKSGSAPDNER